MSGGTLVNGTPDRVAPGAATTASPARAPNTPAPPWPGCTLPERCGAAYAQV
jgi:hypothetical protein